MNLPLPNVKATKKIDAAHIPQANNIFSLKKLLGLFPTDASVLASTDAMVLFDEKRALDYYTNAACKTLGWMESAGTNGKEWVLTPLGKTLHSSLSEETTFCRLAHESLLGNAYYQAIHANPSSAQAREDLAQKPVRDCNGAKEACDPLNGLVLETRFDRLFDQGLITFESDGSMRISPQLSPNYIRATGLDTTLKLGDLHPDTKSYLVYHRKCVFQKNVSGAVTSAPSIVDALADTFAGATASESVALA